MDCVDRPFDPHGHDPTGRRTNHLGPRRSKHGTSGSTPRTHGRLEGLRSEGERSLDRQVFVDEAELDEVGARLDDPKRIVVLRGGADDPEGLDGPPAPAGGALTRRGGISTPGRTIRLTSCRPISRSSLPPLAAGHRPAASTREPTRGPHPPPTRT